MSEKIPEGFKCSCPIEVRPMAEWIQVDSENCKPCALAPVVQWYATELKDQGEGEKSQHLKDIAVKEDPLTICQEMDKIKDSVGEPLRERLKEFDCATQITEP